MDWILLVVEWNPLLLRSLIRVNREIWLMVRERFPLFFWELWERECQLGLLISHRTKPIIGVLRRAQRKHHQKDNAADSLHEVRHLLNVGYWDELRWLVAAFRAPLGVDFFGRFWGTLFDLSSVSGRTRAKFSLTCRLIIRELALHSDDAISLFRFMTESLGEEWELGVSPETLGMVIYQFMKFDCADLLDLLPVSWLAKFSSDPIPRLWWLKIYLRFSMNAVSWFFVREAKLSHQEPQRMPCPTCHLEDQMEHLDQHAHHLRWKTVFFLFSGDATSQAWRVQFACPAHQTHRNKMLVKKMGCLFRFLISRWLNDCPSGMPREKSIWRNETKRRKREQRLIHLIQETPSLLSQITSGFLAVHSCLRWGFPLFCRHVAVDLHQRYQISQRVWGPFTGVMAPTQGHWSGLPLEELSMQDIKEGKVPRPYLRDLLIHSYLPFSIWESSQWTRGSISCLLKLCLLEDWTEEARLIVAKDEPFFCSIHPDFLGFLEWHEIIIRNEMTPFRWPRGAFMRRAQSLVLKLRSLERENCYTTKRNEVLEKLTRQILWDHPRDQRIPAAKKRHLLSPVWWILLRVLLTDPPLVSRIFRTSLFVSGRREWWDKLGHDLDFPSHWLPWLGLPLEMEMFIFWRRITNHTNKHFRCCNPSSLISKHQLTLLSGFPSHHAVIDQILAEFEPTTRKVEMTPLSAQIEFLLRALSAVKLEWLGRDHFARCVTCTTLLPDIESLLISLTIK